MANKSLLFFVAGVATGAVIAMLANTETGERVKKGIKDTGVKAFEGGRAAVLSGLDKLADALEKDK